MGDPHLPYRIFDSFCWFFRFIVIKYNDESESEDALKGRWMMRGFFTLVGILCLFVFLALPAYSQDTATLTVRSRYGSPDPPVGTWTYALNTEIPASVATPVAGTPGIRYVCTGWRARGSPETLPPTGEVNSVTFTITMNTTLSWIWRTQYLLTTTVIPEGSGTVDISPTSPDGYYDAKSTVSLTASDNTGYDFGYWSGGLRGTANPQDLLLRGPRNVIANFVLEKRYLTVGNAADPDPPEPNPPVGTHEYDYGETVTVNCGPNPYPGGLGVQYLCTGHLGTGNVTDGPETEITIVLTVDSSVTWLWKTQYYLTIGSAYGDPVGAGWYNSGVTASWSVTSPYPGATGVQYVTSPTSETVLMDSPKTVTVTWTTQYYLTTDISLEGGGTIVCEPAGPWYNAGAVVTLTATPNAGYAFLNWSGDLSGTANPQSVTMDGPKSAIAKFVVIPVADFTATPTSGEAPLTLQFADESTGDITSWGWDFDNNGTVDSTSQNPGYTYNVPGRYTVKLTVTGPGGSDSKTTTDCIRVIDSANRIYVRTGGSDASNGQSWATAKKTIQAGINAASADWSVLVAKGTYNIAGDYNLDFAGKAVHLKGVTAGAPYDSGAVWQVDCENVSGRRAFIFQTGETMHTVIDNFTLYRGNVGSGEGGGIYASGASPTIINCTVMSCRGTDGGGVYCESGANLTITNCTIKSNQATDGDGGGIYCVDSSPRITGCTIGIAGSANTATNNGGGLYCYNSNLKLINCAFEANAVTWWGGGICSEASSPKITNCQILSNIASDHGGGIYLAANANATITDSTIAGNSTDWFGAGVYVETSTLTITGCTIGGDLGGNNAGYIGGGVYFYNCSPEVSRCKITSNSAVRVGGGIECDNSASPVITNCLIAGNSTTADPSTGDGNGAGIDLYYNSDAKLTNCTIAGNTASRSGGGIYCSISNPVLNNTIVWGNSASLPGNQIYLCTILLHPSSVTLKYCDYADNTVDPNNIVIGNGAVTATNCIVSNPTFVDAAGGDYQLDVTSPCIDAGSNAFVPLWVATDLDGNWRIVDGNSPPDGTATVDIGAYEHRTWTQYYLTVVSPYGEPQGEGWYDAGTIAHWSVTSPYLGGIGIRYVTSPTSGDVLMDSPKTVTVTWTTQYYLTVDSLYGDPAGAGWYDAGVTASWSVTSPYPGAAGVQYVTSPASGTVVMDSPKTVTLPWATQYYLTIDSAYGDPVGAGWYDAGATANWSVTPYVWGAETRYLATPPTSGSILMDSPKTVTVTWTTQYYLTINPDWLGSPYGAGWYDAGSIAHWSVTTPVAGEIGIQYVATWPFSGDILMDSPKTVTVNWTTQYMLTTTASPSAGGTIDPPGANWYNSGATVQLTANANAGYVFANWSGDLSGSTNPQSLTMDAPKTVTANFALPPVADFSASLTTGNVPLTVQFTDASTGAITSWSWDFGVGATPPTASAQGPHYVTYNTEGLKTVSLTVTGPGGTDTETKVDYINVLPPALVVAGFSGSPRSAVDPSLTVQFADESVGNITSWEWDFDNDGTPDSTEQNPSYTYTTRGRFTVKLTVTGPEGSDSKTKTDYVRVCSDNKIYVRTGGSDSNDGLTWANAKKTVQAGITAASNDYAVLVAKGTYKAAGNINLDFAGKAVHLKGVTAGGGYDSGTTWTIDGENVSGRRAFIFQTNETAHTVIDNFTLYRGNSGADEGGGIYASGASPTIINCTVMSCRGVDGGGVYCESNANLTITNCTIKSNQATDGDGGGIYCLGSSPRIAGCTIGVAGSANSATNNGGGLCCYNSNPRVTDCTFDSNSVTWWGGGVYCSTSSPKIINCQILSNVASDQGGGVYLVTDSNATITGCTIAGNSTGFDGAGIYLDNSNPAVTNCTIGGALGGNASGDAGGGIYCFNSPSPAITNCSIVGNSGTNLGGGIYCENSAPVLTNSRVTENITTGAAPDGDGGGVYCYVNSSPAFINCTIAGNSATSDGGGIYCWEAAPVLSNSIVWGNSASLSGNEIYLRNIPLHSSTVTLRYCDYADNTVDPNNIVIGNGAVTATNCIVSNPLFVDVGSGDYHLQLTSPCIDTGSDALVPAGITTDLDGNPRIVSVSVDIGAYEYQP